jgi:hypothetical protein
MCIDRMVARGDDLVSVAAFAASAMEANRTLVDGRRALRMAVDAADDGDLDRAAELWNGLDAVSQYHADKFVEHASDHGLSAPGPALSDAGPDAARPSSAVLAAMRDRDRNRCRYDEEPVTSKVEVVQLVHALGLERLIPGESVDVGDLTPLRTQVYPGFTASGDKTLSLDPTTQVSVPNANAPMAKYYPVTDVGIGDHVDPHARGGRSDLGNLVVCCNTCNYAKANWTLDELSIPRLDPNDPPTPHLGR